MMGAFEEQQKSAGNDTKFVNSTILGDKSVERSAFKQLGGCIDLAGNFQHVKTYGLLCEETLRIFDNCIDFHTHIASQMFDVSPDEVTKTV